MAEQNKSLKSLSFAYFDQASPWLRWAITIAWMLLIFSFSAQAHSGEITARYLGTFNILVRKLGHFSEYAVLFTLLRWCLAGHFGWGAKLNKKALAISLSALLLTAFYAASDEWHQSFVPGRSSSINDVFIDITGGAAAWLLTIFIA